MFIFYIMSQNYLNSITFQTLKVTFSLLTFQKHNHPNKQCVVCLVRVFYSSEDILDLLDILVEYLLSCPCIPHCFGHLVSHVCGNLGVTYLLLDVLFHELFGTFHVFLPLNLLQPILLLNLFQKGLSDVRKLLLTPLVIFFKSRWRLNIPHVLRGYFWLVFLHFLHNVCIVHLLIPSKLILLLHL